MKYYLAYFDDSSNDIKVVYLENNKIYVSNITKINIQDDFYMFNLDDARIAKQYFKDIYNVNIIGVIS